jgi:hypothetical protein
MEDSLYSLHKFRFSFKIKIYAGANLQKTRQLKSIKQPQRSEKSVEK